MVRNVHERLLAVPASWLGPLLDRLGGPDDLLWPAPAWAPMVLDGPVAPGVSGRHSGIRYRVTDHRPQRSVTFTLEPGQEWHGTHTFSVHPTGPTQAVLRHEADARLTGALRLMWPVAMRWLHDALVEDLLDRAEAVLGCGPAQPARWSPWVRLLRRRVLPRARAIAVPDIPLLAAALPRVDFADAYAVRVFPGAPTDPQVWADTIFRDPPRWVVGLLLLREAAVGLVGIARGGRSSFDTVARTAEEVLLGTDERHLDFRASVRREPQRVVLTTVVRLHNRRGRGYFALVRRVHPAIVRGMLNRAARRLSVPASGFCNAVGPDRARMAQWTSRRSTERRSPGSGPARSSATACTGSGCCCSPRSAGGPGSPAPAR